MVIAVILYLSLTPFMYHKIVSRKLKSHDGAGARRAPLYNLQWTAAELICESYSTIDKSRSGVSSVNDAILRNTGYYFRTTEAEKKSFSAWTLLSVNRLPAADLPESQLHRPARVKLVECQLTRHLYHFFLVKKSRVSPFPLKNLNKSGKNLALNILLIIPFAIGYFVWLIGGANVQNFTWGFFRCFSLFWFIVKFCFV